MDFMVYAHLQLAQDGEAKRLVEESAALYKTQAPTAQLAPTGGVLAVHTAFAAIPARYAIERSAWADAATLQPRPSTPAADAITYFTRAMGAVRQGDPNSARKDIEQLESLKNTLTTAKQKYWADQVEIQRRAAAAWLAQAEGKKNEALKLMRSAAALEDSSEKHVAMENRLWPMRELLGEMLLQQNEPAQALKEFEASFKAAPNRFRGYYGAAKAAERVGDQKKARSHYEKLVELSKQADADRPELREAKTFLAEK
jgi:tetratricopeptide (TPR) repeat protein